MNIISLTHEKLPKVYLRPLVSSDAERCTKWINDPEIRQFVTCQTLPNIDSEIKWIESVNADKNSVNLAIVTKQDNIHIGNIGLDGIHWIDRRATTGALIGEAEYRNGGYGTEAKLLLLKYAFSTLGLRKICSSVLANNIPSRKYLEKTGYKEEGCLKDHVFVNDELIDLVQMAVFREDFIPIWNAKVNS